MKAIMVRASANGKSYIGQFLTTGTAAVGWGGTGDLRITPRTEVVSKLASVHKCIGHGASSATTAINGIFNAKIGDIILMPNERNIYLGEVVKEYWYDNHDIDAAHIIGVKWHKKPFLRENLSNALQTSLRNKRTVASLDSYVEELSALLNGTSKVSILTAVGNSYTFLYSDNKLITISGIPEHIEIDILKDIFIKLKKELISEGKLVE